MNPALGFVKTYRKKFPNVQVGVICSAQGGSSIEHWEKERVQDPKLYAESIRATQLAMNAGGELKGICWHQGEANSKRVAKYSEQLKVLVNNFREDLGDADLPLVFSQIAQWGEPGAEFNAMIVKQPEGIANTACVKTDELSGFDKWHFDSPSQRKLGQRFADLMIELLENK